MAKGTDDSTRVFVKKLGDGTVLERTVTSAPGSEVDARFDGYVPKERGSASSATASTTTASSSTSSGGNKAGSSS